MDSYACYASLKDASVAVETTLGVLRCWREYLLVIDMSVMLMRELEVSEWGSICVGASRDARPKGLAAFMAIDRSGRSGVSPGHFAFLSILSYYCYFVRKEGF